MIGNLTTICRIGLVAALVGISARCLPAAAAETMPPHGAWHGFVANQEDESGFGISARTDNGGLLALVVKVDDVALIVAGPGLKTAAGRKLPVHMMIDGVGFGGDGFVVKRGMIRIPDIDNDVVEHLAHGSRAKITIGKKGLVWNVSLDGFSESLKDTMHTFAQNLPRT
jgi:hypothetical protein